MLYSIDAALMVKEQGQELCFIPPDVMFAYDVAHIVVMSNVVMLQLKPKASQPNYKPAIPKCIRNAAPDMNVYYHILDPQMPQAFGMKCLGHSLNSVSWIMQIGEEFDS